MYNHIVRTNHYLLKLRMTGRGFRHTITTSLFYFCQIVSLTIQDVRIVQAIVLYKIPCNK